MPHAGSVDLGDGVLERLSFDIFLDRPVLDLPLQADEMFLLERLGEVGEIAPGVNAVPFGAGFILALLVLPALAGGDAEDGIVLLVLRGFDFCILCKLVLSFSGSIRRERQFLTYPQISL